MHVARGSVALLASLITMLGTGCAPAYRSYSGCYVDCQYCVPPPLPYSHYAECVCHSCAATKYLSTVAPTPMNVEADGLDGGG